MIRITKEELAEAGSFFVWIICPALTDSKLPTQNLAGAKKSGGR
ncbi:glycine dehydrogenase [Bacillus cereus group sp. BceL111]|uniref:Glycine dehydrogenase n=2 Tax=Bacillus cereus group TaxID=86661 RepID=A0A9X7GS01_BACCE|nr:glycine dehydrogenase [Bacillus cereus]OTZ31488.1 glycine dehydrogenase [Bacillus thuringiensis serovar darmstadiensis]QFR31354.1 glycine dehydrogenase [Bacillus thuringiensis]TKV47393.1 glycine dehydrogenase [Bacillus sp. PIC28]KAB2501432.1 glycine dehydrogenase [Bacillus cereus]MBR9664711.1 glycine dehydrogenase [Bacillus cereus]